MHSSSLGARPGGFLCRHELSSQCALHKHHNLNNLGIRQEIWQNLFGKSILFFKLFGKIDFQIHRNLKNRLQFLKYSEKSIFIMQGRLHTLSRREEIGRDELVAQCLQSNVPNPSRYMEVNTTPLPIYIIHCTIVLTLFNKFYKHQSCLKSM